MANPCYVNQLKGDTPVTDEERFVIWKWAKENVIDPVDNPQLGDVHKAINDYFFGGQGNEAWITDILSGRKTPFKQVANDMWKKQYNRRVMVQQAQEISKLHNVSNFVSTVRKIWGVPRSIAVAGHGIVFPVTHAGDLVFRPESWGVFFRGALRTYRGAASSAYAEQGLRWMERQPEYTMALRSKLDAGPKSLPVGLISTEGPKTGFFKAAARAWDMLTVMRFELWRNEMAKYIKPGMSEAEVLAHGTELAEWANHATGSATGAVSKLGGEILFGPKLTQSKIHRLFQDPAKTIKTFANWREATGAERAVAWTRLKGAAQYLGTLTGLLAVNQGLMQAFGQKDKVNMSDPMKGDFLNFKGGSLLLNVPGLHSEIRVLAKIMAAAFLTKKELHGETRFSKTASILGQYGMGKLHPTLERGLEVGFRQDWLGRPLPWSKEPGTSQRPKLSYGEYAASIGPIPLEGPIGYVYDTLREGGMSALNATAMTKALIIGGMGAPGFHIREDYTKRFRTSKPRPVNPPFAR